MQTTTDQYLCLCGAGSCNIPEAVALRQRLEAEAADKYRRNHEAFALFCADRDAGLPTKAPAQYLELVR